MTFDEYQHAVERTIGSRPEVLLGLIGEIGELYNKLKKRDYHGHDMRDEEIAEEMADCLWYLTALTSLEDWNLEEIAEMNIEKLLKRYPEGFSIERSKNRKEYNNG